MKALGRNSIKTFIARVDWNLLVFLLLFMNVKLVVKLAGLLFIYWRRQDFSFGFSIKGSRLPLFYPAMICIAVANYFLWGFFRDAHYTMVLVAGIGFWAGCILALHQVKISVDKTDPEKLHAAILLFFVINAFVSAINLLAIIVETGALNPYLYQGMYQKYFIGTGDYIRGVSFDTSTTNAILNAFGIVYFLYRKQFSLSLMCTVVLLLTCSNFTTMVVIICLVLIWLCRSNREQKSIIVVQLLLVSVFMIRVSPHNNKYALKIAEEFFGRHLTEPKPVVEVPITQRPDSILSAEEKKFKYAKLYLDSVGTARLDQATALPGAVGTTAKFIIKPDLHRINIHAPEYQHRPDSSETRLQAISLLTQIRHKPGSADTVSKIVPGKITASLQVYGFMKKHPSRILLGDGLGNFSSKMAFRATGLKIAGGYPVRYAYTNEDFEKNHLSVYLTHFGKDSVYHSIANSPNSFYLQVLSEYGLLGLFFFVSGYLGYFMRSFRKLSYGFPVLLIMLGAFVVEYWFEQLSIVVMFELMLLSDLKSAGEGKSL